MAAAAAAARVSVGMRWPRVALLHARVDGRVQALAVPRASSTRSHRGAHAGVKMLNVFAFHAARDGFAIKIPALAGILAHARGGAGRLFAAPSLPRARHAAVRVIAAHNLFLDLGLWHANAGAVPRTAGAVRARQAVFCRPAIAGSSTFCAARHFVWVWVCFCFTLPVYEKTKSPNNPAF